MSFASSAFVSFLPFVVHKTGGCRSLQLSPQVRTHPQQVGEYAAGGDRGPGAWALHHEWILMIAAGHELDDVVGQVDVRKRVRAFELDEADARLAARRVPPGTRLP